MLLDLRGSVEPAVPLGRISALMAVVLLVWSPADVPAQGPVRSVPAQSVQTAPSNLANIIGQWSVDQPALQRSSFVSTANQLALFRQSQPSWIEDFPLPQQSTKRIAVNQQPQFRQTQPAWVEDVPQVSRGTNTPQTSVLAPLARQVIFDAWWNDGVFPQKLTKSVWNVSAQSYTPVWLNIVLASWQQDFFPLPELPEPTQVPVAPIPAPVVDWGGGKYHQPYWQAYQLDKREWEKKIPPKAIQAIERVARSSKKLDAAEAELRREIAEWDSRYSKMLLAMQAMQLNSLKVLRQIQLEEIARYEEFLLKQKQKQEADMLFASNQNAIAVLMMLM